MQHFEVSDIKENARRWSGYVCPDCRFVFRVPRDHDGVGIVCGSCRRILKIPGPDDVPPPLLLSARQAEISGIKGEIPKKRSRKKRGKRENSLEADWDRDRVVSSRDDKSKMKRMLIVSGILFSLIVAGIVAALTSGQSPLPTVAVKAVEASVAVAPAAKTLLDRNQGELAAECQVIAQKFLDATSVEELLSVVYNPETAEPRIRGYYADGVVEPQGLKDFNVGQAMQIKGKAVSTVIRNNNFDAKSIIFIDGPQGFEVYWESFVGWSEMPWLDFIAQKPTEAKEFRVILAPVDYYNFDFADDRKWQSYTLQSPDGEHSLYGYVERESTLNFKIMLNPDVKSAPMILSLKYPEGATSGSEVIIEDQIAEGWIEEGVYGLKQK